MRGGQDCCVAPAVDCKARLWWASVPSWGVLMAQLRAIRVFQAGEGAGSDPTPVYSTSVVSGTWE